MSVLSLALVLGIEEPMSVAGADTGELSGSARAGLRTHLQMHAKCSSRAADAPRK